MASFLKDQTSFPDLDGWDDYVEKIKAAQGAKENLRIFLSEEKAAFLDEEDAKKTKTRFEELRQQARVRSQVDLAKLDKRLTTLASSIGTQREGSDFQPWFYDLMDYFEIDSRRPYTTDGRQIDGSVTIDGRINLVELKNPQKFKLTLPTLILFIRRL